MSLVFLLSLTIFSILLGLSFSQQFTNQISESLKNLRISIIDENGSVLFDNLVDPLPTENHLNRPEVAEALENKIGESERISSTLDEKTWYYALRLPDGNILRLALTAQTIRGLLTEFIPVLLLCLMISSLSAFILARRLTKKLVDPINNLDLDNLKTNEYDELLPLIKKIEAQKQELSGQLTEIENRSSTINAVTSNMQEGLLMVNPEGKVLLANESVLKILDISEAVGKHVIEICRIPVFLENVNACLNGEKRESIIQFDEDFYNVLYNPVHDEDVLNGAVLLFIDVSERYAAERHRKEFSANVSHELKTPITSIAAYSEMIADGTVKEEDVKPFAAKINNQAKRLIEIINDIIKLSEFDEGEKSKAFSEVNLYKLAETVINNLQEKASQQNVSLSLVGEKALTVNGNPLLLDEMLFNLIDNAIKYNKAGGEVSIELTSSADSAKVVVKDSGIGIPKAHLPHIFERFYRVDKSRSKKTGGTGLGLSIVKHIAEFHGGSVEVESEENVGSIFTCLIAKNRHEPDG